ncbi:TPA: phenylalanine--tRNA ligase subunit beta [Candidatus Uhrbacteria bacterium]|uniref:Phenylalanine--tRNA ligase beta subunit n=2 Tax=Candidatus Uhriibacteriota TaxID=1752732 RepID=A0A0G1Q8V5_9BACT|nr:MAG: Phenylalanine-tRNA ligase beta subunit [Candidatus Uhrbacteria bacterium GW2011_GWF2_46_218]KKU41247.1 MAG: Phenylalanine-tRNA ligase beta subunit [Candidatus Uhrbacteria bacterium GW2011_GWE2_46_68]HBK34097.1 phenylalanine--tRNA ligase subunit beta [Candidatus Uhrbacteria bacterium]HCB19638.1 phenylalanine--tRNA ligase subunit beta [Candidatus Uhrbacteria bacterium]
MNIMVSYSWLKEYLHTDLAPDVFATRMTNAGNSVERLHDLSSLYRGMVVGEVKRLSEHPNANKLHLAFTDIGGREVEIVCGGVNLKEGMKVAVALPGSKVRWHGKGDLVTLEETEIRGVKSVGMICAASELGFEKMLQGEKDIWDIGSLTDAPAGTPLAEALGLEDTLFDIEVTTNRPDAMCVIGQAREGGAVTEEKFEWKPPIISASSEVSPHAFKVEVEAPDLCPKYQGIRLDGVKVEPSPWWLQKKLLLAGYKPINNIVDVTNYILHEYGQPLHAFDADTIEGATIVVRRAKKGETIAALDGTVCELTPEMLVIADIKKPVAIAGVMGGLETGTQEKTTKVIIESAIFDPLSIRRTARALNLPSAASQLFEKGLSAPSTDAALGRAVELILQVAGGKVASSIITKEAEPFREKVLLFDPDRANALMGIILPKEDMIETLERLGFEVVPQGLVYHVTVPYWRQYDIEASVDFTEEVARIYGYDRFPSILPSGTLAGLTQDPALSWQRRIKQILCGAGCTEMYAYAFTSKVELTAYGYDADKEAVRVENPLSTDQEFMRPSLIPSLLTMIEMNEGQEPSGDLFELAPVYHPQGSDLPKQELSLVIATYGKDGEENFYRAKGLLERLLRQVGIKDWTLDREVKADDWHAGRSARVMIGGKALGVIGQVAPQRAEAFRVSQPVVLISLDAEAMIALCTTAHTYEPLSLYPPVKRDLAFIVDLQTEYETIVAALRKQSHLLEQVELFDVYRGSHVGEGKKSLALHLSFRAEERTLEAGEVEIEIQTLTQMLIKQFSATMRG